MNWLNRFSARDRRARRDRTRPRAARPRPERLETRSVPALLVGAITAAEGIPFRGPVATFDQGDVAGDFADFRATIDWGDGDVTAGGIEQTAAGRFRIVGTNTYPGMAGPRPYNLVVRLVGAAGSVRPAQNTANVADTPITVTGTPFEGTAGVPFTGLLAAFSDPYQGLSPGSYLATIFWGDGRSSVGSIAQSGAQTFQVTGSHTYSVSTQYASTVTVTRLLDGQTGSGGGTVKIDSAPTAPTVPLSATGRTIVAVPSVPFVGEVASFTATNPTIPARDFVATISWGDGHVSRGNITGANGRFTVSGTNTYTTPGTKPIAVTINQSSTNSTVVATSQAVVVNSDIPQPFQLAGRLSRSTDAGPSDTDGITNINQPIIQGTAQPFSLVRLFGGRAGLSEAIELGGVPAGPDGPWSLTTSPLADGPYAITAVETPAGGFPGPLVGLTTIVIDTQAPRIVGLAVSPRRGRIDVVFRDLLSGLAGEGLLNPANYNLIGPPLQRFASPNRPTSTNVRALTSDPVAIRLAIPVGLTGNNRVLAVRINSGSGMGNIGISDLAGNALDGEYRAVLPTGDGHPGGNTVIHLCSSMRSARIHLRSSAARHWR